MQRIKRFSLIALIFYLLGICFVGGAFIGSFFIRDFSFLYLPGALVEILGVSFSLRAFHLQRKG